MESNGVYAIRGAITVEENSKAAIDEAVLELMKTIVEKNNLDVEQVISAFFTFTGDLNAGFPAEPVRKCMGWDLVPMISSVEIDVPGGLPRCIRVMVHVNISGSREDIAHVYLREARSLRPDL